MTTLNGTAITPDLLTGEHVRLHLYRRGAWPPETLFTLWQAMRADGALEKVFWGIPPGGQAPFSMQGDLVSFVKLFDPDPPARRDVLIAESLVHQGELVGAFWFDDHVPGVRVAGSVWYRRRFWGVAAREASKLAVRWGFATFDVPAIWAYTPWPVAARHAEAEGLQVVARLPDYIHAEGRLHDLYVLKVLREEVSG
jgi:RimJ/RimL family protein N-acetyltransferase